MISYRQYLESASDTMVMDLYHKAVDQKSRLIPEEEEIVRKSCHWAYEYAKYVLRKRWPEAEPEIEKDQDTWTQYLVFLSGRGYKAKDKIEWFEKEGITDRLFDMLNSDLIQMEPEVQAYILERRPDLIGSIHNLHPSLKTKYPHELELAGLDI